MSNSCNAPVPFATLIAYWLGELGPQDQEHVEEHFLGCANCSRDLEELVGLGTGVKSAFEHGAFGVVISSRFLDKMKEFGMRVREYAVAPGEGVRCTLAPGDDAVVGRLKASLSGVVRVDLIWERADHGLIRLADVPFDASAGEVLFCPAATVMRKLPAHTDQVRLLAVDGSGERTIGDYVFNHVPS
jgi:hypothetical protein